VTENIRCRVWIAKIENGQLGILTWSGAIRRKMFSPVIYNINVSTSTVLYYNACYSLQDELTGPQELVALRTYYVATVFIDDRRR
jgi:hypothetical protein